MTTGTENDYIWDIVKYLSPNGIELLIKVLDRYQPEPWEAELRQRLVQELKK